MSRWPCPHLAGHRSRPKGAQGRMTPDELATWWPDSNGRMAQAWPLGPRVSAAPPRSVSRSQRRLLLLQSQRRQVGWTRRLERRQLAEFGAAARAWPLERASAVHAPRRRRPRMYPGPRCAGGWRGARRRRWSEMRLMWDDGRAPARGRASSQRRVGAGVTCAWTRGGHGPVPRGHQPAERSPPTCC